jgi:hypothetical protein
MYGYNAKAIVCRCTLGCMLAWPVTVLALVCSFDCSINCTSFMRVHTGSKQSSNPPDTAQAGVPREYVFTTHLTCCPSGHTASTQVARRSSTLETETIGCTLSGAAGAAAEAAARCHLQAGSCLPASAGPRPPTGGAGAAVPGAHHQVRWCWLAMQHAATGSYCWACAYANSHSRWQPTWHWLH